MNRIDITTSQNIVVRYELASLLQRVLATLFDLTILIVGVIIIYSFVSITGWPGLAYILGSLLFGFYHLFMEIWNKGQSLGKKVMKIKVVNLKGKSPSPEEAFQRWVFRLIDILPTLGSVAAIYITSSHRSQRLGDVMAGTSVIKITPDRKVSLQHIDKINERDYKVVFPEIVQYEESRIVFIKEVIERHRDFPSDSTRQAINELSEKIKEDLNLNVKDMKRSEFLTTLIKDYVALTR
jgi:uncharacterized RDD family membrane protein YckC